MVTRQTIGGLLTLLGLGLVVCGCRQIVPGSDSKPGLFGKKAVTSDEGPPPAAPALYIPDRAPTALPAPASVENTSPAPGITLVPVSKRKSLAQPEILPLQTPQTTIPKFNAAPDGPSLPAPPQLPDQSNPFAPLRELYQKAAAKNATMDSYVLRLRRREVVGTMSRPEEVLLFKWRKEPWSVYFKWLESEGKGREVVYVKGRYDSALHTLTAAGDIPLLPAGKRFKLAPDGVLVKSKSRYPITEAGLGGLVERFGKVVDGLEKGDPREGTAKYLGQIKRPEYANKVDAVLQNVPPKSDPNLPRGGTRQLWFFDPTVQACRCLSSPRMKPAVRWNNTTIATTASCSRSTSPTTTSIRTFSQESRRS